MSFEDRQDLLGHRSGRVTTQYSAAELANLIAAANRVCERDPERPELVVLRRPYAPGRSRRLPQNSRKGDRRDSRFPLK